MDNIFSFIDSGDNYIGRFFVPAGVDIAIVDDRYYVKHPHADNFEETPAPVTATPIN